MKLLKVRLAFGILISLLTSMLNGWVFAKTTNQDLSCSESLETVSEQNAFELFASAVTCYEEGFHENGTQLLLLGQVRFKADMGILFPVSPADEERMGELYFKVFYNFGGLGSEDVMSDQETVARLEKTILTTPIVFSRSYNPGWNFSPSSPTEFYELVAENEKRRRLWQLKLEGSYLQNERYRLASDRSNELQRKVGAFEEGTAEEIEFNRQQDIMAEIRATTIELPEPIDTTPYKEISQAVIKAQLANSKKDGEGFKQIKSGMNGPSKSSKQIFTNAGDVRSSWISEAIQTDELELVLSKIDFTNQVFVAVSFGEISTASGNVFVTKFSYDSGNGGFRLSTKLGIQDDECLNEELNSDDSEELDVNPYVLATTNVGSNQDIRKNFVAYTHNNFPDDCRTK